MTQSEMRLYLAQAEQEKDEGKAGELSGKAKESWEKAKTMVEEMGYGRRKGEVEEIGRQLGASGEWETLSD